MNADHVLSSLEKKGKVQTQKIYRRHGVAGPCYGVSYADMQRFTKSLQCDHALSLALWKSGVHDARVLATRVADPQKLKEADFERWLGDVDNYILDDAVASLAARSPLASVIAKKWIKSPAEWRAAAGWTIMATLAVEGKLSAGAAKPLLPRIQREIPEAANRARHAMNNALIAIGGSIEELREHALQIAKAIGKVEVDHGQTHCKTPDAASYIQKMADHARTRVAPKQGKALAKKGTSKKKLASKAQPLATKKAPLKKAKAVRS